MTWKKSSLKLFNFHYFLLLLKRYLWLIYVPLGVYLAFVFLFLVLGIDPGVIGLFLFPYALVAVPATALIVFRYYTKKGEVSHIFSLPLRRVEQFVTTYIAGLVLVLVPIVVLSLFVGILGRLNNFVYFILTMPLLGIIYYTFASLGCMLGGTLMTQLMMMAVVSFGPLVLYLLINLCVDFLAFGNLNSQINSDLVARFCPLASGMHFVDAGIWDQWFFHILEVITMIALCIFLAKNRPLELSGQPVVFKNVQNYFLKPMFYLNIVFLIFYMCSTMVFRDTDFSTKYYVKLVALLVGTGFIIAFMMNVWFSRDMRSLFSPSSMGQSFLLTLVSCFFFFVPLWQKEHSRVLDPQASTDLEVCYSGFGGYACYGYGSMNEQTGLSNEEISKILHYIDENRELFVKGRWYGIEEAIQFNFRFENSTDAQTYFIYPKNLDGELITLVNELFLASRNDELKEFDEIADIYYQDIHDGTVYTKDSYVKAIESTFGKIPTDFIMSHLNNDEKFDGDIFSFSQRFYEKYHASLNAANYDEWLQFIKNNANVVVDEATWLELTDYLDTLKGPVSQFMSPNTLSEYQNLKIRLIENETWKFIDVKENLIKAEIPMILTVGADMQIAGHQFFEASETRITFLVELSKKNGEWQMDIQQMREVNY